MSFRCRPPFRAGAVLVVGGLLVAGCSPPPAGTADSSSLLDALADATVHGDALALLATGTAPGPGQPLRLVEEFSSLTERTWYEGWEEGASHDADPKLRARRCTSPDGSSCLEVPPGAQGIVWDLPCDGVPLAFAARVRGGQDSGPVLRVLALARGPGETDVPDAPPEVFLGPVAAATQERWVDAVEEAEEGWRTLSVFAEPLRNQRGWRVRLECAAGVMQVDRVQAWEPGRAGTLCRQARLPGEAETSPLRRKVTVASRTMDALLLTPGSRLQFSVKVPGHGARLDTELALLVDDGGTFELVVRVEREEVARVARTVSRDPGEAPFEPLIVPLERFAGRSVDLSFALEGPDGAVAALGNPRLLGAAPAPPPAVVLFSLDTLRADHVGCYGFPGAISPRLDRFAAQGVRFEHAYSPTCYTLPAHASIMSGQHTLEHGLLHEQAAVADPTRFLAETLRAAGYSTAAFTGGGYLSPAFGFSAGMDSYDVADPGAVRSLFQPVDGATLEEEQRAAMQPVLDWIGRHRDQPFFLFLHTYLVHNYGAGPRFLARAAPWLPEHRCEGDLQELSRRARGGSDPDAVLHLKHLYAAAVLAADERVVGPLLDTLEAQGLEERTLVVILSDHGEEFREHGKVGHGQSLYQELVRVPMLWRGPGIPAGKVRGDLARLRDVAPSILAFLGIPAGDWISGDSLFSGSANDRAYLYHTVPGRAVEWEGVIQPPWKYVRWRGRSGGWQDSLFRLGRGDRYDLAPAFPAVARELEGEVVDVRELLDPPRSSGRVLGEETVAELRRLGYLDEGN